MFIPITTQASISVIVIPVLSIILGVLMIAVNIGFILFMKYERSSISKDYYEEDSNLLLIVATV